MSNLKLFLFGPPRIELDGKSVEIQRRKVLAMLIYLAVTGQPHTRDALATLFYPDHPQQRARTYLRRDLAVLNSSLNNEWLIIDRETVELEQTPALWVDVAIFEQALTDTQAHDHPPDEHCPHCQSLLDEAAQLYSDDFLTGFTLRDCPQFDDWQFFEAESFRQSLATILENLSSLTTFQDNVEAAIPHGRRWVNLDPLHEPAQRRLIHLYALAGQQAAALRQYEAYVQLLENELGLPPEEETTTLYEAIKAKRLVQPFLKSESRAVKPPGKKASTHPVVAAEPRAAAPTALPPNHNLPAQATPFVGRQQELARISEMLTNPDCRLVTMVGPGGIGKTRLSIEVARTTSFQNGIWFVPLTPLTSTTAIIPAIAASLNLSLQGSINPKQQLLTYLRDRELLLVLDNFDHLISGVTRPAADDSGPGSQPGVELITELLANVPRLKILLTSRERLNLSAEWVFTVEGLQIPDSDEIQGVENYSAVQLFIQLARRVDQNIGWHPLQRSSIARICRLVGGMPLGIELAAAWVSVIPVIEIPHEIERNLDFLASTMHDVPERHRSMRAIFDQSWSLLTETERVIFGRLSVFQGSFTRAAIEVVCSEERFTTDDLGLDEAFDLHLTGEHFTILQALSGLVGKSFLRQITPATPAAAVGGSFDQAPASPQSGRYETHELMRQYGASKLAADPDDEQRTRDRHALYYVTLLARLEAPMKATRQRQALEKAIQEFENIRAGWKWATERGQLELLLTAIEAMWILYAERSQFREGNDIYASTIATLRQQSLDPNQAPLRQLILGILYAVDGGIHMRLGDYTIADTMLEQALSALRPLQADRWVALALNFRAANYQLRGDYQQAGVCLTESIDLSRRVSDSWLTAYSLNDLGMVTHQLENTDEAQQLSQESLSIFAGLGDQRGLAFAFYNLGYFAYHMGDYPEADWLYRESLALRRVNKHQWGVATVLNNLAAVARAQNDPNGARTNLIEAIQTALEVHAVPIVLDALVMLADLFVNIDHPDQAQQILQVSLHHPALSQPSKEKATELLTTLQNLSATQPAAQLPEEEATRALYALVGSLVEAQ